MAYLPAFQSLAGSNRFVYLKRIDGEWKADGAEHRLTGL
jgi:hypothetical protein